MAIVCRENSCDALECRCFCSCFSTQDTYESLHYGCFLV